MDDLTDSKLQTAYELIKAGQKDRACEILIPLVRANPNLADSWFLLGHAVNDTQEKIRCFQQVLRLEPDNDAAQKQLARLLVPQAGSPIVKAKPAAAKIAKKSSSKKRSPALLWGAAGLALVFIGLSGFGIWQGGSNSLFSIPAPIVFQSSTASAIPTVTSVASTSMPKLSLPTQPTSRPTITLFPTSTPQPSVTILPTLTIAFTETPGITKVPDPKGFRDCLAPNGLGKDDLTAPFKIENFGRDKATVFINGKNRNGNNPIYCRQVVKQGLPVTITLMFGDYDYIVMRGSTTMRGSFFVNQPDKATMRIYKDKIQIGPFP